MLTVKFFFFLALFAASVASRQKYDVELGRSRSRISTRSFKLSRLATMEDVFNLYDSTFLAHVWPKLRNGMHMTLGQRCWDDLTVYYMDLLDAKLWAYSAVDATGRYEAGLFDGNRYWLGSPDQCRNLDNEFLSRNSSRSNVDLQQMGDFINAAYLRDNYYDGNLESEWHSPVYYERSAPPPDAREGPPFRLAYFAAMFSLNVTKPKLQSQSVMLGLCLPHTCTASDVRYLLDFSIMINDNLKTNRTLPRTAKTTSVRIIHEYYDVLSDPMAILLIIITVLLQILVVLGTCADFGIVKFKPRNCKSMSFDLQQPNANIEFKTHEKSLKDYPNKLEQKNLHSKLVDMETLTINNINNANINMVTVKKVVKPDARPPSITLDVVAVDDLKDSCNRCGKYKKQCPNQRKFENLPPCPRMNHSFTSFAEEEEKNYFCKSVLLCFSLRRSWQKLTNSNLASKELALVHVMKIVATLWIMYLQVATLMSYISDNTGEINADSTIYTILATGSLAFDTLIFVSGVLSAHHVFYLRSRYTVQELVSFGGCCGHVMQLVCFVTNRAIRLLPAYIYAIMLTSVVSRAIELTSPLAPADPPSASTTAACDALWWRNLLYITNLYPADERCMQISWYLTTETQLHLLATIVLVSVSLRGSGRGAAVAGCAGTAAVIADLVTRYWDYSDRFPDAFAAYSFVVERGWARVAPYCAGVGTGWALHHIQEHGWTVSKLKLSLFWVVSLLCCISALASSVLGGALSAGLGRAGGAALAAAAHALWPAVFVVAALTAAVCPGTSRAVVPARLVSAGSRLCGATLLLHSAAARLLMLPAASGGAFTAAGLWAWYCGTVSLTLVLSLSLSLLLETPSVALLRTVSDCAAC